MKYSISLLLLSALLFSCSEKKQDTTTAEVPYVQDTIVLKKEASLAESKKEGRVAARKIRQKKGNEPVAKKNNIALPSQNPLDSEARAMDSLYAVLDKAPEIFLINNSKDTTITCTEGTIVTIPANCFLDKNRKKVSGIIRFEIKEYYSSSDMLFASLNSVSDGNLMETGGMLYLQASSNGSKLSLAANKTVKVEMPTSVQEEGMQLFYGQGHDRKLNWKKSKKNNTPTNSLSTIRNNYNIARTVSYIKNNAPKVEVEWFNHSLDHSEEILKMSDTLVLSFKMDSKGRIKDYTLILNNKKIEKPKVKVGHYKRNITLYKYLAFINDYDDISFGRSYLLNYKISKKASFHGLPVTTQNISLTEENLKNLKKSFRKQDSTITVSIYEIYTSTNSRLLDKVMKEKLARIGKDSTVRLTKGESEYYIYNLNNLGWINCDKFYDTPAADKTNYRIAANEANSGDVKIIFNDIKSIMPGTPAKKSIDFRSIPKDMDITVIGIRYKNSQYEFASTKATTSDSNTNLQYFPVSSIIELKEKIAEAVKVN